MGGQIRSITPESRGTIVESSNVTSSSTAKNLKKSAAERIKWKIDEISVKIETNDTNKLIELIELKQYIEAVHNSVNSDCKMPANEKYGDLFEDIKTICTHRGTWLLNNRTNTFTSIIQAIDNAINKLVTSDTQNKLSKNMSIEKAFIYCLRKDSFFEKLTQISYAELSSLNDQTKSEIENKKVIYTGVIGQNNKLTEEQLAILLENSKNDVLKKKLIIIPTGTETSGLYPHAILIVIKNGRGYVIDPNSFTCADSKIPLSFERCKFGVQGVTDGHSCIRYIALIADDLAKRQLMDLVESDLDLIVQQARRQRSHTPYTGADLLGVEALEFRFSTYNSELLISVPDGEVPEITYSGDDDWEQIN